MLFEICMILKTQCKCSSVMMTTLWEFSMVIWQCWCVWSCRNRSATLLQRLLPIHPKTCCCEHVGNTAAAHITYMKLPHSRSIQVEGFWSMLLQLQQALAKHLNVHLNELNIDWSFQASKKHHKSITKMVYSASQSPDSGPRRNSMQTRLHLIFQVH